MDVVVLGIVICSTLMLGALLFVMARGWLQRLFVVGMTSGLFIYSGVGAAYDGVDREYLLYYILFMCSLGAGFTFSIRVFSGVGEAVGRRVPNLLASIDGAKAWKWIIPVYLGLFAVPLIYPEFRLHHLVAPPPPDLRAAFAARFATAEVDVVGRIVKYLQLLLTPFFYVALYRYRDSLFHVGLAMTLLLYIRYVDLAYMGRGTVIVSLTILFLAAWITRPRLRPALLALGAIGLPTFLYAGYFYTSIRLGNELQQTSILQAISGVLEAETSFPRDVGMAVLRSRAQADLWAYVVWITTLPIPKILTGAIEGARINYEISTLVLRQPVGAPGWYVVLPGLVAESIYIYGRSLFWIHGVFIGALTAFVVRLMERVPQLMFLSLYASLLFGYVLNRGGIGSLLPVIVNGFLLFYLYLIVLVLRLNTLSFRRSPESRSAGNSYVSG